MTPKVKSPFTRSNDPLADVCPVCSRCVGVVVSESGVGGGETRPRSHSCPSPSDGVGPWALRGAFFRSFLRLRLPQKDFGNAFFFFKQVEERRRRAQPEL